MVKEVSSYFFSNFLCSLFPATKALSFITYIQLHLSRGLSTYPIKLDAALMDMFKEGGNLWTIPTLLRAQILICSFSESEYKSHRIANIKFLALRNNRGFPLLLRSESNLDLTISGPLAPSNSLLMRETLTLGDPSETYLSSHPMSLRHFFHRRRGHQGLRRPAPKRSSHLI